MLAIPPYIKSAFDQWYAQNTQPELSDFLAHYFGRPPNPTEVGRMETLLGLRTRFNRDQEELGLLHSQAVQLRERGQSGSYGLDKDIDHEVRENWSSPQREGGPRGSASVNIVPTSDGASRYENVVSAEGPVQPEFSTSPSALVPRSSLTDAASSQPQSKSSAKPSKTSRPAVNGELYERLAHVGEGTYGKVYKARNVETGAFFALKRIRMEGEKDGFPVTAMREIKLLQNLRHPNVLRLAEMMVSKGAPS